ncbi:unnamed protein product, partial [Brachionus calyciflorus]
SDSEKLNDYFMASSESVSHNTIPSEIISSVDNQFGIKWGEWDQSDNFTTTLSTSSSTIPPVIISSINISHFIGSFLLFKVIFTISSVDEENLFS